VMTNVVLESVRKPGRLVRSVVPIRRSRVPGVGQSVVVSEDDRVYQQWRSRHHDQEAGPDRASPRRRSCRVRSEPPEPVTGAGAAMVFSCSLTAISPPAAGFRSATNRSPCRTSVMKVASSYAPARGRRRTDPLICTDVDTSL
jgi:hypothetical protein